MGSIHDKDIARAVVLAVKAEGYVSPAIHVISCHRNPNHVHLFCEDFEGAVVIACGGKSFQLPAVMDSFFRELKKHVVIFGIPVGDTPEKLAPAISAMRDVPAPVRVHWFPDSSEESIRSAAAQAVGFASGRFVPEGETKSDWEMRQAQHWTQSSRINIRLEDLS